MLANSFDAMAASVMLSQQRCNDLNNNNNSDDNNDDGNGYITVVCEDDNKQVRSEADKKTRHSSINAEGFV